MSKYAELRKVDVSKYIEKKNGLSYLSWSYAVDQLLQADETATWEFPEPKYFGETMMVYCDVTAFGKTMKMHLPVMDLRNKAVINPNTVDINKAQMRCLAKCIACFGLGLYIYSGSELPEEESQVVDVTELEEMIILSKDMEELKKNFAHGYKVASKDKAALVRINKAKEDRKAQLA
jgi:hypothetical protein